MFSEWKIKEQQNYAFQHFFFNITVPRPNSGRSFSIYYLLLGIEIASLRSQ